MKKLVLFLVLVVLLSNFASAWYSLSYEDRAYRDHLREYEPERYQENYGYERSSGTYGIFGSRHSTRTSSEWKSGYVSPNYKNRIYGLREPIPRKYTYSWYRQKEYVHCSLDNGRYTCHTD